MVDFTIMVDLRINETLQIGVVSNQRKRENQKTRHGLVGTVSNCADAVRLETAPTGDESVYLFLEFTIVVIRKVRPLQKRC